MHARLEWGLGRGIDPGGKTVILAGGMSGLKMGSLLAMLSDSLT